MNPEPTHRQLDQASRLRELMRAGGGATTIAVTSGKGGVGKTNVAVNLSLCLAARGLRVTLIDVDMGLANADVVLGVSPTYNLSHVLSGLRPLDQVCVRLPGDVSFISGASGVDSLANLSEFERHRLVQQLQGLELENDFILLDCGAGISRNVLTFALAANTVIVVTTPEPTAITDAYAVIKLLSRDRHPGAVYLLVNMVRDRDEAKSVFRRIADVAAKFLKYPIADGGYILQDMHVESAVRHRSPFVLQFPRCPAAACLMAVASKFHDGRRSQGGSSGFFRRVVGLFA